MDEVMLTHADDEPKGLRPGGFSFTPQGVLHWVNEAFRAEFQAARTRGCAGRGRASVSTPTGRSMGRRNSRE
jgi:hypothetical protein